ncbi:MAG: tyrosine-type recombinase/integrase, partial [Gammaproteobacteria bacterium]
NAKYLAHCKHKLRASTYRDYEYNLTNYFPFGRKSIVDLKAADIQQKIDAVISSRKRYAFATIRAFMKWCIRQEIIDRNPMERLQSPKPPKARNRILTDDELRTLTAWFRANNTPFAGILGLLLYTGQRRGVIARLEWNWIEGETITLPSEVTKNHQLHTFPLSTSAQELVQGFPQYKDCPYVFPAAKKMSRKRQSSTAGRNRKPRSTKIPALLIGHFTTSGVP